MCFDYVLVAIGLVVLCFRVLGFGVCCFGFGYWLFWIGVRLFVVLNIFGGFYCARGGFSGTSGFSNLILFYLIGWILFICYFAILGLGQSVCVVGVLRCLLVGVAFDSDGFGFS